MIGRAAHGQPWLLRDIAHYLHEGVRIPALSYEEKLTIVLQHIANIHAFYGEFQGVKMARKHVAWYGQHLNLSPEWRRSFNNALLASQQMSELEKIMDQVISRETGEVKAA
jgi:tRNA-dihydrouridine synthase B